MAEKYGCEVSKDLVVIRSPKDIDFCSESATGQVTTTLNGVVVEGRNASGVRRFKSHSGYAGSDLFEQTVAVTTTDATATNILSVACPISTTLGVWVQIVGKKVGANADGIVSQKFQAVTNNAGTVAVVGTTGGSDVENASGTPAVTIVANNTADTIEVKVTGIAAETWAWAGVVRWMQVTSSS